MAMKQINVAEATGPALDWLVAKCEGDWILALTHFLPNHGLGRMNFSTSWAQGGPIIERELISIYRMTSDWSAAYNPSGAAQDGPTALIAAMRCYVASKLGDTAEVPEELP